MRCSKTRPRTRSWRRGSKFRIASWPSSGRWSRCGESETMILWLAGFNGGRQRREIAPISRGTAWVGWGIPDLASAYTPILKMDWWWFAVSGLSIGVHWSSMSRSSDRWSAGSDDATVQAQDYLLGERHPSHRVSRHQPQRQAADPRDTAAETEPPIATPRHAPARCWTRDQAEAELGILPPQHLVDCSAVQKACPRDIFKFTQASYDRPAAARAGRPSCSTAPGLTQTSVGVPRSEDRSTTFLFQHRVRFDAKPLSGPPTRRRDSLSIRCAAFWIVQNWLRRHSGEALLSSVKQLSIRGNNPQIGEEEIHSNEYCSRSRSCTLFKGTRRFDYA